MELTDIRTLYDNEQLPNMLQPADEERPLDQLVVLLDLEEVEAKLALELVYIPAAEDEFEEVKLLQFFVMFPWEFAGDAQPRLRQTVLELNVNMPIMGFGLHEADEYLYFRHVLMLPKKPNEADGTIIVQTTWLIYFLMTQCYAQLQASVEGGNA